MGLARARAGARSCTVAPIVRATPVARPRHPVLLCNPWSGGGKVARFGLVELAEELGVEVVMLDHGLDLEQLARDAVARGADCLGMAGGDGSQALVASIADRARPAVRRASPPAPGTTSPSTSASTARIPARSLDAFRDAVERRIDYATVGDRLFVNNVSLGIYATIVQQEGYRDAKAETTKALLPEMLGRTDEPFDLQFTEPDGTEVDGAFLIQVSNNPYVLGATLDASQRRRLDTGTLGVVAVTGTTGRDAAPVVTLSALGQRRRSRRLARVHHRALRGPVPVGQGLRRRRRRGARARHPARVPDPPARAAPAGHRGQPDGGRQAAGPRRLRRRPVRARPGDRPAGGRGRMSRDSEGRDRRREQVTTDDGQEGKKNKKAEQEGPRTSRRWAPGIRVDPGRRPSPPRR